MSKEKSNHLRFIFKLLYRSKRYVIVICGITILISSLSALSPLLQSRIIDHGIVNKNINDVIFFLMISFGLSMFMQILEYMQKQFGADLNLKCQRELKNKVFSHGIRLKEKIIKNHGFF